MIFSIQPILLAHHSTLLDVHQDWLDLHQQSIRKLCVPVHELSNHFLIMSASSWLGYGYVPSTLLIHAPERRKPFSRHATGVSLKFSECSTPSRAALHVFRPASSTWRGEKSPRQSSHRDQEALPPFVRRPPAPLRVVLVLGLCFWARFETLGVGLRTSVGCTNCVPLHSG